MKVLIIGSNGRVGSSLLKKLADKNYQVLAGSRRTDLDSEQANVTQVYIDC
ncbi:NAD-dependent epimerase/dehydratase family protein [uncultured Chryseobacterium sp.]|uniref:NAD-dependent epimerase/dehydratase family protein n=1 Tax=Chryseobacterium sp. sg2396 TaxID=3276280 RepID=UPI0025838DAE|nr:NAD-dependent epimerase/dehydratase family protein [uncultured Chryseobacterium sp.]